MPTAPDTPAPIRAPTLATIPHGFFGSGAGQASEPGPGLAGVLNCSLSSGDDPARVLQNRARVAAAFGLAPAMLLTCRQVHGAEVITATAPWDMASPPQADAIVTATPGLGLSVLTADCAPVLLADPVAGVIGATHAGWRGALGGVLAATVRAMQALGAEPMRIRAAVGPTISQRAYEVGPDFADAFLAEESGFSRFFANGTGDRLLFDLPRFVLDRLRACGISEAQWSGHCTYGAPGQFFSHRRDTHQGRLDAGRQIAVITL